MASLRIGSRGSQLALWQANHVASLLRGRGFEVGIEIIKTTGDKITEVPLSQVGTKGMFTKEIEEALAEGKVDLAVHSLKDLPTELAAEFELAAIMKREDARDALVSNEFPDLAALPRGSVVGTSSLRREAQLRALRPDLKVEPLLGNVDTRLRKVGAGEFSAIILAYAGMRRLGKEKAAREIFDVARMCPAAGQGALAVEIRQGDSEVRQAVEFLDDPATSRCTDCERSLLHSLGGGCQVPIGAFAEMQGDRIHLVARVGSRDGSQMLSEEMTGEDAVGLGAQAGEKLLARGAAAILKEIYGSSASAPAQP